VVVRGLATSLFSRKRLDPKRRLLIQQSFIRYAFQKGKGFADRL